MPTTALSLAAWGQLLHRFSKRFSVERLTTDRVGDLCAFFKRAYADQPLAEYFQDDDFILKRWRWLNEDNPTLLDNKIPAWVCYHNRKIVGHFAVIAAEGVTRGKARPVCWGRDLIVAPEVRQLGVGPLLVMTAVSGVRQPFLVAGINEGAYAIYSRLGFVDGGLIPLYLKVYQPSRLLETLEWSKLRRILVTGVVKATQFQANRRRLTASSLTVKPLVRFDDEFDRWWGSLEGVFPCVIRRTSATMTWRYHRHPAHRYHVFAAWNNSILRGVLVLRHGRSRGMPAGFVSELLSHPDDRVAIDSLLGFAEEFFSGSREPRPVFVRSSVLHPAFARGLIRAGFLCAPSPTHWMMAHTVGLSTSHELAQRDNWFLNGGDSDIDML